MLRIIIIVTTFVIILLIGFYLWIRPQKNDLENPFFIQNIGKILGFSNDTTTSNKPDNLVNQTKDSIEENAQKNIESFKETVYKEAKTTLDNVFNKTDNSNDQAVSVNILNKTNADIDKESIIIDLSRNDDLKLNLSLNKKYYLKFQNIPQNYCLYILSDKYPIKDGAIEIQFNQSGNYPLKANNCDLNEKNIGTLTVE